jgi:hypothetical protein
VNKRLIAFLSILSLSLSLPLIPAYAAVKAGGACKKAGVTSVALGKTYTCVKSGKKLAWNKGRASVVTPVQVIPDSWPIDKSADKNIFLIADKNFRKFQQLSFTLPNFAINYGPTVEKKRADEHLISMHEAGKFWSSDWKYDKEVNVAIGTSKDYSWMFQAWSKFGLIRSPEFDSSEKSYTSQGEYCNQGSALLGDDNPFFWGCLSTTGTLEKYGIAGRKFGSHEYTHIAQYGIMSNSGARNMPVLLMEGSAEFYGVSLASTQSKIIEDWQTFFSGGYFTETSREYVRTASADQVYELLMDSFNKGTKQEGHWYYTGAYATIRMIAAQGHDGFVRFMKSVAETSNANQSFEKIYGIKFEDFAKIIAPEISVLAKTIRNR